MTEPDICVEIPETAQNSLNAVKGDHHAGYDLFKNPWSSFDAAAVNTLNSIKFLVVDWKSQGPPDDIHRQMPSKKPTWTHPHKDRGKLKATWLGHAAFLVELPAPEGATRGPRVLFDPVFSDRCSPVQFYGPERHTKAPCQVIDLPEVDAVLISHDHYDHMDTNTIDELQTMKSPHFFAPLGNDDYLSRRGIASTRIHTMDWWQSRVVTVPLPRSDSTRNTINMSFEITCVPAQHQSNRGVFDRNRSLWAGFAVTSVTHPTQQVLDRRESTCSNQSISKSGSGSGSLAPSLATSSRSPSDPTPFSCYFAGDTGYGYEPDDLPKEKRQVCPAFKEIGERFCGFDLALLPIGAYTPREYTSSVHCNPQDAVDIFKDVLARRAIAMHWGTWMLTNEPVTEPREKLKVACKEAQLKEGAFETCELGETVFVECDTLSQVSRSSSLERISVASSKR